MDDFLIPLGEPATGLPSDRVLGVPVAAAMHPLPETCCTQQPCFRGKNFLTPPKRRFLWVMSLLAATATLVLAACADALSSNIALHEAAHYQEPILLRPGFDVPAFYVQGCLDFGTVPVRVEISFYFLIICVVLSLLGTIFLLIVSQGCMLCCAPCACCDAAAKTNTALGLSIPLMLASAFLFCWNLTFLGLDMQNCLACDTGDAAHPQDFNVCAAGFNVGKQQTGISVAGGICGAAALALAGFYCLFIPRAIQDAVRYKARNMTAMHGSISLNAYIGVRAMAVSPNLVPSNREAALSSARTIGLGSPMPSMGARPPSGSAGQISRSASGRSWGSNAYPATSNRQPSPLIISLPRRPEQEPSPTLRNQGPHSGGAGAVINFGHRVPLASQDSEAGGMPRMVPASAPMSGERVGVTSYVLRASDSSASDTVWTGGAAAGGVQAGEGARRDLSLVSANFEQIAGRFTVLSATLEHEAPNSMEQ